MEVRENVLEQNKNTKTFNNFIERKDIPDILFYWWEETQINTKIVRGTA